MKPILIIGGGLTGLALAQALKKHEIPFQVYERDASLDSRTQGYRIRLNRLGLEALHDLLPKDIFDRIIHEAAQYYPGLGSLDSTSGQAKGGLVGTADHPEGLQPPPIFTAPVDLDDAWVQKCTSTRLPVDRRRYRDALASGINIEWGKAFQSYTVTDEGVTVQFEDGSHSPVGSLVVGCDGASSRVSQQLGLSSQPENLDSAMIYGKAPLTDALKAEILPSAAHGIRVALEERPAQASSKSIGSNLFIEVCRFDDSAEDYVFFVLTSGESFHSIVGDDDPTTYSSEKVAELAKSYVEKQGYHAGLQAILKHQDVEMATCRSYRITRPDHYPTWKTNRRVTILGDAVHALPPVGGMSGNAGLQDVRTLAACLSNHAEADEGGWSESVIKAWEDKAREEALIQVKLVHAATTGAYPLVFWKRIYWDGKELDLPAPLPLPQ